MHIVLISGSHRQKPQSIRVTTYLAEQIPKLDKSVTTDIINLSGSPLPFWDERMWEPGDNALKKVWAPFAKRLEAADGFVVISPEWHGMVPSGLKNFFLFTGAKEVGHKPAMLVGVSAGHGGAYPIDELRISSYKNNKMLYIPDHLIVRNVEKMFVGETPTEKDDEYIRERANFTLQILLEYAKAMKSVRDSGKTFDKRYAFGM